MSDPQLAEALVFCCDCNKQTRHLIGRDANQEFLAVCKCSRFVKFPAGIDFEAAVAKHNAHNKPVDRPAKDREVMKLGAEDVLVLKAEDLLAK